MLINRKSIYYTRLFLDLFILNLTFIAAAVLSQSLEILLSRNYMFILLAGLNFLWYFISNIINFYDEFSSRHFAYQFTNLLKIIFVQAFASILFIFIAKEDLFTRNFILYHSFFLFFFISLRIALLRFIINRMRGSERNVRNMLIAGSGSVAKNFAEMIKEHPEFGYSITGFLDDNSGSIKDEKILGEIKDIDKIIIENNIDTVVAALSGNTDSSLEYITRVCNKHAVRIHIIPDYFKFISKKFQVNVIGNFPIITVRSEPLSEVQWRFIKRIFDIILSFFLFIFIFSWLFPVVAVLIKITSKGPVFFNQDRVGAKNEIFKCYKFRTMFYTDEEPDKFKPAVKDDPRVTGIGKFLRKSNIDEMPQFFNVLKGEMSVVGPRPHSVTFDKVYTEIVDEIKIRGWVKPGITGWAQINGLRGDVPDYEENRLRTIKRIEYDLWYIENWSVWLDIQIILITIWQMIKGNTRGI